MSKEHIRDVAEQEAVRSQPSATHRAYEGLRRRIISGEITPGERLKIESLKTLLDMGASPIREALSLLTSDQLVERIDQRGFRSAPANKQHFEEILMLRCQLEDLAIRGSIEQGGTPWEENLVLCYHRLQQASNENSDQQEVHHRAFHRALLLGCGSPILLRFCDQLYDLNIRYRFLAGKSGTYKNRPVDKEHQAIVDASLARDASQASAELVYHYKMTGEFLVDQFND